MKTAIHKSDNEKEILEIKRRFSEKKRYYYSVLEGHVTNLARKIKIFSLIAENSELLNKTKYSDFFVWLQGDYLLLPSIRINSVKILNHAKPCLEKIIKKIFINDEHYKTLILKSKIDMAVLALKENIKEIHDARNRMDAHLVVKESINGKLDIAKLYQIISDLYASLTYIYNYILNPIYIIKNELPENIHGRKPTFYFDRDPAIKSLENLISTLNF